MKRLFFTILGTLTLLLGSCNLDNDEPNFHFEPLRIVSAELPESFQLNQTYQITVTYELPNNCTGFSGFDVTQSDTTVRNVVVFGSVRTDREFCTEETIEEQATFNFVCNYSDTYMFRFWQGVSAEGEQEYFEVEVPVN